jgi:CheY-like chemotaxis protein
MLNLENSKKKILVVDDQQELLLMYRMNLGEEYEVVTAVDGKEALERAAVEKPDFILMDVMMPRMNGLEACRKIRQLPSNGSVPIVMATSSRDEAIRQEAWDSGCNDFLAKPTDWNLLAKTIRSYLVAAPAEKVARSPKWPALSKLTIEPAVGDVEPGGTGFSSLV